jgi:Family of unknown function (DUF6166)
MDDILYRGFVSSARPKAGERSGERCVYAGDRLLSPAASQKVWNHSPDGFEWGYCGSGPAQLALALLMDAGLDDETAVRLHQEFKRRIVAGWTSGTAWSMLRSVVLRVAAAIEQDLETGRTDEPVRYGLPAEEIGGAE